MSYPPRACRIEIVSNGMLYSLLAAKVAEWGVEFSAVREFDAAKVAKWAELDIEDLIFLYIITADAFTAEMRTFLRSQTCNTHCTVDVSYHDVMKSTAGHVKWSHDIPIGNKDYDWSTMSNQTARDTFSNDELFEMLDQHFDFFDYYVEERHGEWYDVEYVMSEYVDEGDNEMIITN